AGEDQVQVIGPVVRIAVAGDLEGRVLAAAFLAGLHGHDLERRRVSDELGHGVVVAAAATVPAVAGQHDPAVGRLAHRGDVYDVRAAESGGRAPAAADQAGGELAVGVEARQGKLAALADRALSAGDDLAVVLHDQALDHVVAVVDVHVLRAVVIEAVVELAVLGEPRQRPLVSAGLAVERVAAQDDLAVLP